MNRRRTGKGGIVYSYTPEEERQQKRKKAMKNILPIMADLILELHGEGESRALKSGKSKSLAPNPNIEKLKKLLNEVK